MTAIPTSATGGFNQPRENTQLRTAPTRGARTRPLPRRNYCPGAFARWRAVADPHLTPPQEIRVETWIELVGMLATALRAGLLKTDPELKGRWTAPPAKKRRFFGVLE